MSVFLGKKSYLGVKTEFYVAVIPLLPPLPRPLSEMKKCD